MERVCVALVTAGDAESADRMARALVIERLAACVNVVPGMTSHYRWEGEVHRDDEVLMIVKTTESHLDDLIARVAELHPYDVPEVLGFPVHRGHAPYLAWVTESVEEAPEA